MYRGPKSGPKRARKWPKMGLSRHQNLRWQPAGGEGRARPVGFGIRISVLEHFSTPFATYCNTVRVGLVYGPFGREEPCLQAHNVHTLPAPRHRVDRPAPSNRRGGPRWGRGELRCELAPLGFGARSEAGPAPDLGFGPSCS